MLVCRGLNQRDLSGRVSRFNFCSKLSYRKNIFWFDLYWISKDLSRFGLHFRKQCFRDRIYGKRTIFPLAQISKKRCQITILSTIHQKRRCQDRDLAPFFWDLSQSGKTFWNQSTFIKNRSPKPMLFFRTIRIFDIIAIG